MNKKVLIVICIISLFCNLTLAVLLVNTNRVNTQNNKIKEALTKKQKKKDYSKENIVFLGDSITDWCPFDALYDKDIPIINSGRAGYRTFSILEEMDDLVYKYNPTKVFILIGTNDLNTHTGKDQLVNNIEKMIKGIKKHRPNCKIYVESIYPVNKTDKDKIDMDKVSERENDEIKEVNARIKNVCKKQKVKYINVYKHLVDDEGKLTLEYTKDGLHLSDLGYLKVTKVLTPYVEE